MNIIIVGCGKVGASLAERLSAEAKEALRRFDELTGNTLHQNDGSEENKGDKKKKKGFMDKLKEVIED